MGGVSKELYGLLKQAYNGEHGLKSEEVSVT